MKVVILNPRGVMMAGIMSALLVAGSVFGSIALLGLFRSEPAEAYGNGGVGAKTWYFAEGYTGPGFEEWILIFNPPGDFGGSGRVISPVIQIYGNGGFVGSYPVGSVQPGQRRSINLNSVAGSFGYSGDVSIVVTDQKPFISERALYFNYKDQWTGGSQVLGYQEGSAE